MAKDLADGHAGDRTRDRIVLLDSLRGLAILGILICNIPVAFEPEVVAESVPFWPHGQAPASLAVWWITQAFFQQKFYTLFGMLFGASVLLVGGDGGDRGRTVMIVKRLLALMLMGMGLFKTGVLKGQLPATAHKALAAVGLSALVLVAAVLGLYLAVPSHPQMLARLARWMQALTAPAVSLGYLALLALALDSRFWRAVPALLAPVGQMAFTNYLMQSVIMTVLAYGGRGPELFGKLDRPALAGIVAAMWAAQILWSHWWLKRFTMGPLEWVWRLAYRGPAPLRRAG